METIPIIDFGCFLNGSLEDKQKVSKELIEIVKKYGFIYLKNYGISKDLTDKLFEFIREFFDQSLDEKMLVKRSLETFCGYAGLLEEKLTNERPGDLKESYMLKKFGTPWPKAWPEFKEFMETFHSKCFLLALEILRSFSMGLNIEENIFINKFSGECTVLRLLHYPPLPEHIEDTQIRCGEHTDYGGVSFLFQDPIGGLEVKTIDEKWISAPFFENTVLLNVGDAMEMWTNGLLKSTLHRVVNPTDEKIHKPRYSAAFFCDPDLDTEIKCIEDFVSIERTPKYQPILYRNHIMNKFKRTFPNLY